MDERFVRLLSRVRLVWWDMEKVVVCSPVAPQHCPPAWMTRGLRTGHSHKQAPLVRHQREAMFLHNDAYSDTGAICQAERPGPWRFVDLHCSVPPVPAYGLWGCLPSAASWDLETRIFASRFGCDTITWAQMSEITYPFSDVFLA